jgi:predicted Fe-Mo cluster-binding NifX family protein
MMIAITADGTDLKSSLDPRFGRCPYFLLVDPETLECRATVNPGASAGGAAGIKAAQTLTGMGTKILITGQCGPNAFRILEAAGMQIMQAPVASAGMVVEMYKRGELAPINAPGKDRQGMQGRVR